MMRSRVLMWGLLGVLLSLPLTACQTPQRTPYEQYLVEKQRNDRAMNHLRRLGAQVNMTDPGAAVSLRDADREQALEAFNLLHDLMLLDSLRLTNVELTRGNLHVIRDLHLRHLTVSRSPLTPRTLDRLFTVQGLRSAHLIDTGAGDAAVEYLLRYPDLERVTLAYEPLTDEGLLRLGQLRRLRTLRLVDAAVTEEALDELVAINTRLVIELGDDAIVRGVDATR